MMFRVLGHTAALLAVSVFTLACRHSPPKTVVGPDGQSWYVVDCDDDRTECIEQAGKICPSGYQLGESSKSNGAVAVPINGVLYAQETTSYKVLVQCRAARAAR